jgi:CheY-like chemotaxis protein
MSGQVPPTTVLLVEDDPDDVWLITRALTPWSTNLRVQVVHDGEEAIRYLSGSAPFTDRAVYPMPSIVLLDIQLPGLDGLGVLKWIRESPRLTGMIVIMLTGSESPAQMRLAYDLHVNSFLKKTPMLSVPAVSGNVLSYWLQVNHGPPPRAD